MASSGRAMKVVLTVVGAIVGVFVIALVLLAVFFPSDRVRTVIQEQAGTYLDRPLTIGDIGLSFWPLGAAVEDVVIGNNPALSDEPLFAVDRAVISVHLWPLIARREVTIREISIQGPRIAFVIGEDGTTSTDGLLVEQPEAEPLEPVPSEVDTTAALAGIPLSLIIQEFSITNGRISFVDRQSDMDVTVGSIDQTLQLDIHAAENTLSASGEFTLADVTLMAAGQGVGPTEFSGAYGAMIDLGAGSVSYVVDLRLAGVPMTSTGSIRTMSTTPELTVLLQTGRIEIERLLSQLRLPPESQLAQMEASGSLTLDAFVHTVIDSTLEEPPLDLDVRLSLDAIRLKHPELPTAIDEISGSVDATEDTIMVGGFRLRAGGSDIAAEAMLVAWMTENPFLKTAEISGKVILDEVSSIVELPDSTAVGGSMEFIFTANGAISDPLRMQVGGHIALNDITAMAPELPQPIQRLNGSIDITTDRITIPDIGVWIGQSEIHIAETTISDYLVLAAPDENPGRVARATFAVRGPMLNLDELIPVSEDTTVMTDTTVVIPPIELPPIEVNGTIGIDRIVYTKMEMRDLRANVGVRDNRATLDGNVKAFDGNVVFNGWLDVKEPEQPQFAFNWTVESVQANSALTMLTDFDDRLYGSAFSTGSVNGNGSTYGDIKDALVLGMDFRAGNGYLNNWEAVKRISGKLASGIDAVRSGYGTAAVERMGLVGNRFVFGEMDGGVGVANQTLNVKNVGLMANDQQWRTNGTVGTVFDSIMALDIRTQLTFSEDITRRLAEGAASALSLATPVTADDIMPYLDPPNHLRITMPIRGTSAEPDVGVPSLLEPFRNAAENAIRAKARAAREQAEQEVQERVDEVKSQAEEAAREQAGEAVDDATKRIRGILGR